MGLADAGAHGCEAGQRALRISPCGLVPAADIALEAEVFASKALISNKTRIPRPPLMCQNGSGASPQDAFSVERTTAVELWNCGLDCTTHPGQARPVRQTEFVQC